MATDATNTPTTNYSIPKYLTNTDRPTGQGFNAAMDFLDSLLFNSATLLGAKARVVLRKNSGADVGARRRINLIEGSGITLTLADDAANEEVDVTIATSGGGVPAGAVMPYAGSAAPSGWLLADGSAVSRSTYADLFTAISTTYGAGDGSTTFNVPDMRGRMAVGLGTHVDVDALADSDGDAVADRRPAHGHNFSLSTQSEGNGSRQSGSGAFDAVALNTQADTVTGTIGPTTNRNMDAPSYLVLNYIIKT